MEEAQFFQWSSPRIVEESLPDTKLPVAEKTNSALISSGNLLSKMERIENSSKVFARKILHTDTSSTVFTGAIVVVFFT